MRQKIYISGAISHHDIEERRSAFDAASRFCELCGFEAVNPFENELHQRGIGERSSWRDHMRVDLQMLLSCDAICMMDGWESSKGAKLELDVASTCGLTVYYETAVRTLQV